MGHGRTRKEIDTCVVEANVILRELFHHVVTNPELSSSVKLSAVMKNERRNQRMFSNSWQFIYRTFPSSFFSIRGESKIFFTGTISGFVNLVQKTQSQS